MSWNEHDTEWQRRRQKEECRQPDSIPIQRDWDQVEEEWEDPKDSLLRVLRQIERHRENLDTAAANFKSLLLIYPFLQKLWREFANAGGLSSRELARYLDGKPIRYRRIRQRRHLRLVVNQKRKPVVIGHDEGDDVA